MSKGFTNLGNTCYMNAALQCLTHIPELSLDCGGFTKDIRKRDSENDSTVIREWLNFQHRIWKEDVEQNVVSTERILKAFIMKCQSGNILFESFNQNDTTDFLNTFMDLLHESMKRKVNITITGEPKNNYDKLKVKSIETWKAFFENSYSHIIVSFYSQLLSVTTCPKCDYATTNHEPMMTITLTLKEKYKTIYDCLDEFIEDEVLDVENTWNCDKCKECVQPNKKINFWNLSPVLILSVKQFRLNRKMNKHIEFPEELNMEKYCVNKKENLKYKLSGICIHSGGLNGGHYYAMCKDYTDDKWRVHNDTHVIETTIDDVLKQTPYCFFYIRDV